MSSSETSLPFDYAVEAYNKMDQERFGSLSADTWQWNISGGHRVRNMVQQIVRHIERHRLDAINVVNMSGLLHGKPDPIIHDLLSRRFPALRISWTVLDHPESATITDPAIRRWAGAAGHRRARRDHRRLNHPPLSRPPLSRPPLSRRRVAPAQKTAAGGRLRAIWAGQAGPRQPACRGGR